MDTKRWKVMLAADDYGSFTRVGEELGYTQSGITQMMKALEKEVGFSLFIKDNHGVTLTKEAKADVYKRQAESKAFALSFASPTPMLITTLSSFGTSIIFL